MHKSPEHIIVTSKGTRYIPLCQPEDSLDLNILSLELANYKKLRPYIQSEFHKDGRHNFANLYSIYALLNILINEYQENHTQQTIAKSDFDLVPFLKFYESIKRIILNDRHTRNAFYIFNKKICRGANKYNIPNATISYLNRLRTKIKRQLSNRKQKIAVLDDQASKINYRNIDFDHGLIGVLNGLLKVNIDSTDYFEDILQPAINKGQDLESWFCQKEHFKDYACILLDLRLVNSINDKDSEEYTGEKILKIIRDKDPIVPIIVVSSSRRIEVMDRLLENGANAYWMKESIDSQFSDDQCFKHYTRLLKIIGDCTNEKFDTVRKIHACYLKIKEKHAKLWWNTQHKKFAFYGSPSVQRKAFDDFKKELAPHNAILRNEIDTSIDYFVEFEQESPQDIKLKQERSSLEEQAKIGEIKKFKLNFLSKKDRLKNIKLYIHGFLPSSAEEEKFSKSNCNIAYLDQQNVKYSFDQSTDTNYYIIGETQREKLNRNFRAIFEKEESTIKKLSEQEFFHQLKAGVFNINKSKKIFELIHFAILRMCDYLNDHIQDMGYIHLDEESSPSDFETYILGNIIQRIGAILEYTFDFHQTNYNDIRGFTKYIRDEHNAHSLAIKLYRQRNNVAHVKAEEIKLHWNQVIKYLTKTLFLLECHPNNIENNQYYQSFIERYFKD